MMPIVDRMASEKNPKFAILAAFERSDNLGNAAAESTPIITITNTSSMSVNPEFLCRSKF